MKPSLTGFLTVSAVFLLICGIGYYAFYMFPSCSKRAVHSGVQCERQSGGESGAQSGIQCSTSCDFSKYVPNGWKIIKKSSGNLRNSKRPAAKHQDKQQDEQSNKQQDKQDVVLVIEEQNASNVVKNHEGIGPDTLNLNPRRIIVLFAMPDGSYKSVVDNPRFIPPANHKEDALLCDPLQDIEISSNRLLIKFEDLRSAGTYNVRNESFGFDYDATAQRFELMTQQYSTCMRSSGDKMVHSIDYAAGEEKIVSGLNEWQKSTPQVQSKAIKKGQVYYLDNIGPRSEVSLENKQQ